MPTEPKKPAPPAELDLLGNPLPPVSKEDGHDEDKGLSLNADEMAEIEEAWDELDKEDAAAQPH
jgi:hypothetical protein